MPFYFKLPDLGEGITEGEVVKWRVKAGDDVEEHQVIMEVETDKAIVEVPSPKKGTVMKLNKAEGETVQVGEVLLTIALEGEEAEGVQEAVPEEAQEKSVSVVGTLPQAEEVLASPKARGVAREIGVDLKHVKGTGPGGIITEKDVRAAVEGEPAAEAPAPAPVPTKEKKPERPGDRDRWGPIERIPIKGIRKSITKNLIASQRTTAFVTSMDDADVTDLWDLRLRERDAAKDRGVHLTFLPFFIKALRHAVESHPRLNGSVDEETGEIIVKKYFNIGVAIDTPEGLIVAVVRDVDKKTILGLAEELQELSQRARERKLTLDELKGSSITITNYGAFGGHYSTPIINYPDIAILGTGRIADRPWIKDGEITIRKILPLSLTFDHRVVDGVEASRFLERVKEYIEDPALIFIESK
ncbi:MAG: dihydrolipoamide acetyltransferase family protein [Thermodesulfobacteriota bacterium]|nr:MAG: dihydrolipoamide acetyltransferase family protein [Thermodesulfobacteriota bacterium]